MSQGTTCPGCRAEMHESKEPRAVVDFCATCGGLWLDKGELEAQGASLPPDVASVVPEKPRSCPRCVTPLGTVRGRDLELDLCGTCGGIYLDRGELERLVEIKGDVEAAEARAALARGAGNVAKDVGVGVLALLFEALAAAF